MRKTTINLNQDNQMRINPYPANVENRVSS